MLAAVARRTLARRGVAPLAPRLASCYHAATEGELGTESFRIFFSESEGSPQISPWHDIKLKVSPGVYNLLTEIPKMSKAKMEVMTKEPLNPIAQDTKKGKLRDYHGPIFWNYGCLPQTWEDPAVSHPELGVLGDGDPIDAVEIGSAALPMGSVTPVKPLGVLAMIDEGELDWKLLVINVDDPLAGSLNCIADVEAHCPGVVTGVREWFRWYKTPDDKPLNDFGFEEACLDADVAIEVIEETHEQWVALVDGKTEAGKMWTK